MDKESELLEEYFIYTRGLHEVGDWIYPEGTSIHRVMVHTAGVFLTRKERLILGFALVVKAISPFN